MNILIHSHNNILTKVSEDVINRDNFNVGCQAFPYGITRLLYHKDNNISHFYINDIITEKININEPKIDEINQKYDIVVLPLWDIFGYGLIQRSYQFSEFIKRLKIDCVIIGVGVNTATSSIIHDFKYCKDAINNFMKIVLDKTDKIGIRGQISADFFKHCGYIEGSHYEILGCPSMYSYGPNPPTIKTTDITYDSKIAININAREAGMRYGAPIAHIHSLMIENCMLYNNMSYFLSRGDEIRSLKMHQYQLSDKYLNKIPKYIKNAKQPNNDEYFWYKKAIGCYDIHTLINKHKEYDLCIGSRIHGCIAGVLAGCPTLILGGNLRVMEIAQYHNIPFMALECLGYNTDILDIVNKIDFSVIQKGYTQKWEKYHNHLLNHNLTTVYDTQNEILLDSITDTLLNEPIIW